MTASLANKPLTNDQEAVFHFGNLASDAKIHGIFASHGEPSRGLYVADLLFRVGVIRRYWNRPELLEQLRNVAVILSDVSQDDGAGAKVTTECVIRSRRLRERFRKFKQMWTSHIESQYEKSFFDHDRSGLA